MKLSKIILILLLFSSCVNEQTQLKNYITNLWKKENSTLKIYTDNPNHLKKIIPYANIDTLPYDLNSLEINAIIITAKTTLPEIEFLQKEKEFGEIKVYRYSPKIFNLTEILKIIKKRNPYIEYLITDIPKNNLKLVIDQVKLNFIPLNQYKPKSIESLLFLEKAVLFIREKNNLKRLSHNIPTLNFHNFLTLDTLTIIYPATSVKSNLAYELKNLQKHKYLKFCYTNNLIWIKNYFNFQYPGNLAYKYHPDDLNAFPNFEKILKNQIYNLSYGKTLIVIFHYNDKIRPLDSIINLLNKYQFYSKKTNLATYFISHYKPGDTLHKTILKISIPDTNNLIYTNKRYLLINLLGDKLKAKIIWLPVKTFKTGPNKNYSDNVISLKRTIESGKGIAVYYLLENVDSNFITIKELDSVLIAKKININQLGVIYTSKYLNDSILNKEFRRLTKRYKYIYTNKFYVINHLFNYQSLGLPYKCLPPNCNFNPNFEYRIHYIRINLLLDSAAIVYFYDPYDKFNMSKQDILENFKHFKIEDFKDFLIITSYNEQNE